MAGIGDIASEAGVKYEDAAATIEGIRKLLRKGEKITLQDFGTFSIDVQDERKGRNPHSGEEVVTPAKSVPKFKFNHTFKKSIEENVKVDKDLLGKKRANKEKILEKQAAATKKSSKKK